MKTFNKKWYIQKIVNPIVKITSIRSIKDNINKIVTTSPRWTHKQLTIYKKAKVVCWTVSTSPRWAHKQLIIYKKAKVVRWTTGRPNIPVDKRWQFLVLTNY